MISVQICTNRVTSSAQLPVLHALSQFKQVFAALLAALMSTPTPMAAGSTPGLRSDHTSGCAPSSWRRCRHAPLAAAPGRDAVLSKRTAPARCSIGSCAVIPLPCLHRRADGADRNSTCAGTDMRRLGAAVAATQHVAAGQQPGHACRLCVSRRITPQVQLGPSGHRLSRMCSTRACGLAGHPSLHKAHSSVAQAAAIPVLQHPLVPRQQPPSC